MKAQTKEFSIILAAGSYETMPPVYSRDSWRNDFMGYGLEKVSWGFNNVWRRSMIVGPQARLDQVTASLQEVLLRDRLDPAWLNEEIIQEKVINPWVVKLDGLRGDRRQMLAEKTILNLSKVAAVLAPFYMVANNLGGGPQVGRLELPLGMNLGLVGGLLALAFCGISHFYARDKVDKGRSQSYFCGEPAVKETLLIDLANRVCGQLTVADSSPTSEIKRRLEARKKS